MRTGHTPIATVMRRLLTGSQSVKRGEKIVKEKQLKVMG